MTIASGGVLPNINVFLLPQKGKGDKVDQSQEGMQAAEKAAMVLWKSRAHDWILPATIQPSRLTFFLNEGPNKNGGECR